MNIVVAPDKFKGSLEADQVAEAIRQGILAVDAAAEVHCLPMADGGEGTVDAMVKALQGEKISVEVHDPFMRTINSNYGISADRQTAFIEMAKASGILLLSPDEYDTENASTYGTGELIANALDQGVKRIYLGIGGSATTDAGVGMLSALGFEFLDQYSKSIQPIGKNLSKIRSYLFDKRHPRLDAVEVVLMTDVSNQFYGEQGAAHIFASQKGANEKQIDQLDAGLKNFAQVVLRQSGMDINAITGSGAGGGIAGGAVAGFGASVRSGAEVIMDLIGLKQAIIEADLVVTGEGKVDLQTLSGKVVKGVVDAAKEAGTPVAVLCGVSDLDASQMSELGCEFHDSIMAHTEDTDHAINEAFSILKELASKMILWITSGENR